MKLFPIIIINCALAITVFITLARDSADLSLSDPSAANTTYNKLSASDTTSVDQTELDVYDEMWFDTVMNAKGHCFGFRGDITKWGGWYLDTICVGYDNMLQYDSVGPSTLKLSLVTRELVIDLGDSDVIDKIRDFMNPIEGFRRFSKSYEECLDSLYYDGYGFAEYMGGFSFEVDYPDTCNKNARKINRFICDLTGFSDSEKVWVPGLSALYAGFNPTKYYGPAYTLNANDMQQLSDFLAQNKFDNWRRDGNFVMGSNEGSLAIRPHIANERYVTFSKYEYGRAGIGHGMYTETFHTLDLKNGNMLRNEDIFKSEALDKVKMKLFEVMAKDPKYCKWYGSHLTSADIEDNIKAWRSPSPVLKGTEWEEPEAEFNFQLPEGALTESGVVFSFQPYEIDCWAAGTYHFIVPYEKLIPYLTPEAKRLIKDSDSK